MITNRNRLLTITLLILFVVAACSGDNESIQASGVVEVTEVVVAPEIGGRIAEVWTTESDQVALGDPLFRIENKLLEAQLHQAESALEIAQANYDLILNGLTDEQRQATISTAELELAKAKYALNQLFDNHNLHTAETLQVKKDTEKALEDLLNPELQQALAQKEIADATKAIEDAEKRLGIIGSIANQADIDAAWAQVVLAEKALEDAEEDFEDHAHKSEHNLTRANYQAKLSAAKQNFDAATRRYNGLASTGSETEISVAEADLATAQAQLLEAQRNWEDIKDGPNSVDVSYLEALTAHYEEMLEDLEDGPDPDDVALAEARVANAQAQLALAKSESPTKEQLAVAQAQVDNAQTNLASVQVQVDLLMVTSPIDGVVMTSNVELGEIIQPGAAALTIGQLDNLTVAVFIPENRYGQINLGDQAKLTADSFPDASFDGVVIRIADKAEYTPRNVQTQEDRVTTVYAIELSVSNTDGKLKPGMPVDVKFGN